MKKNKNLNTSQAELLEKAKQYQLKVDNNEPLDFNDFKFLLEIHEEFVFFFNNIMYEIVWGNNKLEFYRDQNCNFSKAIPEIYSSGQDFLENARIDGKKIEEIANYFVY